MKITSFRIDLAKRYAELLKNVFKDNLISIILFGSVVRGEDTQLSDIDLMAILKKPPAPSQLKELGKPGRFTDIRGTGEFEEISCSIYTRDRILHFIREGAPREGINPIREAVALYDTGFIQNLKKELETGAISLRKYAYCDYLRYGNIRRSCLIESSAEENIRDALSDAAAAATHYLRAYFLYKYGEMILSKPSLKRKIMEEDPMIARLYETILEGDYNIASLDKIREWVIESIGALEKDEDRPIDD